MTPPKFPTRPFFFLASWLSPPATGAVEGSIVDKLPQRQSIPRAVPPHHQPKLTAQCHSISRQASSLSQLSRSSVTKQSPTIISTRSIDFYFSFLFFFGRNHFQVELETTSFLRSQPLNRAFEFLTELELPTRPRRSTQRLTDPARSYGHKLARSPKT